MGNKRSFPEEPSSSNESVSVLKLRKSSSANQILPRHEADDNYTNNDLIGLEDDLVKIKDQLTGDSTKLELVSIVGMGGIGKTSLARSVYNDRLIKHHFYIRAWIKVSQEYKVRDVLLGLLQSITSLTPDEVRVESDGRLVERLYRCLKRNRYLVVIDDVWNTPTWDEIRRWFPDDGMGSRIILTSRLVEVATYASHNTPHCMKLLDNQESWSLLQKKVFESDICPDQLVAIGKEIANKCQGLPLAIVVIAGQLSRIKRTKDCWMDVAKSVGSLIIRNQEEFLNILSLSYNYLPPQLKACFLYMGNFAVGKEIPVLKLKRLWAAAGFLNVETEKSEELAEKCLDELISRNLILVSRRKFDGREKTCDMHDLLRDLSLRKARKEGFNIFPECLYMCSVFRNSPDDRTYLNNLTHYSSTAFYYGFRCCKWLTILEVDLTLYDFPNEITKLRNLRYLSLSVVHNIPGSVSKLRNLETLINSHRWEVAILPKGIWQMQGLKHLHVGTCTHLPSAEGGGNCLDRLPHLKTLSTISSVSCSKEVILHIPSLEELAIREIGEECTGDDELFNCLSNLIHLHRLEKLKLHCDAKLEKPRRFPDWSSFVPNIKHLTLSGSHLPWEETNTLAKITNLQVLKLKKCAFTGPEWELEDEGFTQLNYLLLDSLDLEDWRASSFDFSNLQWLVIRHCMILHEIPDGIGEIDTLQLIELDSCGSSVVSSARKMQEEGNDNIDIRIKVQVEQDTRMDDDSV